MLNSLREDSPLWDIFTLKNEYNTNIGNSKGPIIDRPIISESFVENGFCPEYPDKKRFAICLSHDVDEIYLPSTHFGRSIVSSVIKRDASIMRHSFKWLLNNKNSSYLNFSDITKLEAKYGARSTFFFLAKGEDPLRYRYAIEDIPSELGRIADDGCEVGLHGGYHSFNDYEKLREEKKGLEVILNRSIRGYRGHYLNLHIPNTWNYLSKLRFEYDSTLGYRRAQGFRNGMCHPFNPIDPVKKEKIEVLEIPLNIMDTAFNEIVLDPVRHWGVIEKMFHLVEKNHGVLTINWHNDSLLAYSKSEYKLIYEKILSEGVRRGAWLTNCEEIHKWWSEHPDFNCSI